MNYMPCILYAILGFLLTPIILYVISCIDDLMRRKRISNITNKHIFVTGCDSGFGKCIAKYLDNLGVRVFAGCLTEKGEKELKSECSSRLMTLRVDVTDPKSITGAFDTVKENIPSTKDLWGIVNNAGILIQKPFEMHTERDIGSILDVNLIGMIYVTQVFLPLIRNSRGRVVNISSSVATVAIPWRSVYCITKVGIEALTTCLQHEMYFSGIKAATIRPGIFRTNIYSPEWVISQLKSGYDGVRGEVKAYYGKEFYKKAKKEFLDIHTVMNPDLSLVAKEVEHALFSVRPRRVYYAGNDSKYILRLYRLFPDYFLNWLMATLKPDGA